MRTQSRLFRTIDLVTALAEGSALPSAWEGLGATEIQHAVIDSRSVVPGSLFVAFRGEHHDGYDFIPEAIAAGAVAIIAERPPKMAVSRSVTLGSLQVLLAANAVCVVVQDSLQALQQAATYWRQQHWAKVIGITGSVGKTTAKEAIAAVLGQQYCTLKSQGNYNNEIGLPLTLLQLTSEHERVVLEMGMYDLGEIAALAKIAAPEIGVVGNVGPSHLERLGSIERIAQAKAELPQSLPAANSGGLAILNADDSWVSAMAEMTPAKVYTYGLSPSADLWADQVETMGLDGIRFQAHHGAQAIDVQVPLLGRHSVYTALCAAAVALNDGLSWPAIIAGLHDQSVQVRLLTGIGPQGSVILDDTYNASPSSCIAALELMAELPGRKLAVLGDMYELGEHELEGHRIVGRHASQVADALLTVGELGSIIGEAAIGAGMPTGAVCIVENNQQAIDTLRDWIKEGPGNDVLLVKGSRGMGMEEITKALTQSPLGASSEAQDART